MLLLPEALEDYLAPESPVRFLDAFVGQLDLEKAGFRHAQVPETGRPPYHPGDLLRLYRYGYLNRVRSSRGLEREAAGNPFASLRAGPGSHLALAQAAARFHLPARQERDQGHADRAAAGVRARSRAPNGPLLIRRLCGHSGRSSSVGDSLETDIHPRSPGWSAFDPLRTFA